MVVLKEKKIGKQVYFYLEHSMKINKKVVKKEKYIGKDKPKDLDKLKFDFMHELLTDKYKTQLEKIKKSFSKEYSSYPKSVKVKYIENFMIKFTYDTQRIEGSTLTLKETASLLEDGISPSRPIKDVKEAEAHKIVFFDMMNYKEDLNLKTILHWHKLLFKKTDLEIAGKIRKHSVGVARSKTKFPLAIEVDFLLRDFFKWYNKSKNKLNPVELASLVHLKFVSIHPFSDGNGRISRLMMNFVLHKYKYPMLNIEYSNRNSYYNALERSQVKDIEYVFAQYLIKRYLKTYNRYLV